MPERISTFEPEGVDYTWVLQVTFVVTIVVGAPMVALLSLGVDLPTWRDRARFAIGIGAALWFAIAIATLVYARRYRSSNDTP